MIWGFYDLVGFSWNYPGSDLISVETNSLKINLRHPWFFSGDSLGRGAKLVADFGARGKLNHLQYEHVLYQMILDIFVPVPKGFKVKNYKYPIVFRQYRIYSFLSLGLASLMRAIHNSCKASHNLTTLGARPEFLSKNLHLQKCPRLLNRRSCCQPASSRLCSLNSIAKAFPFLAPSPRIFAATKLIGVSLITITATTTKWPRRFFCAITTPSMISAAVNSVIVSPKKKSSWNWRRKEWESHWSSCSQ